MSVHRWAYDDPASVTAGCATFIAEKLDEAVRARERADFAISGGSSPRALFRELAKTGVDWERVRIFWVDERCVPPGDPESNYTMAEECLLRPAKVPAANVFRVLAELEPRGAAAHYAEVLEEELGPEPEFDVIHHGMGQDAHTASLFPGEPLIADREKLAAAVYVAKLKSWRVTLCPKVLLAARNTVIYAPGQDKIPVLNQVLEGKRDPMKLPIQLLLEKPGETYWFMEAAV
jgi:6-phosphogluconolactonase